ncbi:hypothetical protein YPPY13_2975 [Yersinia pestis PY-13]|uniref:Uncharacterized protein n=2 Tax=Yersinia pestis TaxID=632 RepID=A0AAV3BGG4_YERPE|nr:hypothetical protein YpAngola_A1818 [Yersinia pestis Angola]EDR32990.1 hypothetical protein YPIP275_0921 [Yersinia pestis biovar Orientalis str. IP275]EDR39682.1 hypothetical protein YpF1991016_1574 [Yersinia pestis biovar Orientalis str. F1991016]EDR44821.1 hypothetical protein YpE1979001_1780 [Yersinia pestis biovar Antiqua str. E1979001]EDR49422.1 hypothetical protein YpB42003004_0094 [Yersinia pestis biovar Antiqua str. B42003004]EDR55817.1 hypothetical protein YpMG051020_0015 [Yersinia
MYDDINEKEWMSTIKDTMRFNAIRFYTKNFPHKKFNGC